MQEIKGMNPGKHELPQYLDTAIRLNIPPKDWRRTLDDTQERYQDHLIEGGPEAAERYAQREAKGHYYRFIVNTIKHSVRPAMLLALLQRFIH